MRLPHGTLKKLSSITGISTTTLCDYAATRKRPSRKRAKQLEMAIGIPAASWLFDDSREIRSLIMARWAA